MGVLYIVSIPIGNVQDLTNRAIQVLGRVQIIACEDTRKAGLLLQHIRSLSPEQREKARLISYYEENEFVRIPEIISNLLEGQDVALISDAGTPLISDPGFKLVRECIHSHIPIVTIPGASSVLAALTTSGLPTDKFQFFGYLPKKTGHRIQLLQRIQESLKLIEQTTILFESPHRIVKTLEEIKGVFGDIPIVITRELTKTHEEIRREIVSQSINHFQNTAPKGEFVILFNTKE